MPTKKINIHDCYIIKLGRNEVEAEVIEELEKGWNVRLTASDKTIKVASANRFLRKVKPKVEEPKKKGGAVKGKMSGLDSAAFILRREGRPMRVKEIAEMAIHEGLWEPAGLTPWASIASAIIREIDAKGLDSRFYKADTGLYGATE